MLGLREKLIFFYFQAKSFLHSQIRMMVGTLLHVGLGNLTQDYIKKMLELHPDVTPNAWKIPGRGLYLVEVEYEEELLATNHSNINK
jgi:tRNA pseudouridine38-40 synthase